MNTINVIVEYANNNFSAYIENLPIMTVGNNLKEIEKNISEAIELYIDSCREMNITVNPVLANEYKLNFKLDAATFINYYSGIFTKSALSRITGINERQLWHYAAGVHKPRKQQLEKIQQGINNLTTELSSIHLL
ncbi:MAG: type II toxin-antitoxin system HicB family antitoxin [Bacteroidales bacterium]|nr:type II toxin-antitoxin system HicB family antitoxin [Bacteroidales bacterium]